MKTLFFLNFQRLEGFSKDIVQTKPNDYSLSPHEKGDIKFQRKETSSSLELLWNQRAECRYYKGSVYVFQVNIFDRRTILRKIYQALGSRLSSRLTLTRLNN